MVILDAAMVFGLLGIIVYAAIRLLTRPEGQRRPVLRAGRWRCAHYDVDGVTRVVLQKLPPDGAEVLDEHLVATVPIDDPEYEARFLSAMATARERRALFDSEEE
jgi:hypothetical protein